MATSSRQRRRIPRTFLLASVAAGFLLLGQVIGLPSGNAASITGTKGRIDLPPGFFAPTTFTLHRAGAEPEVRTFDFKGRGYQYEAAEVQRCLTEGLLESPLMPQTTTLEVMNLMDTIRAEIGVDYVV